MAPSGYDENDVEIWYEPLGLAPGDKRSEFEKDGNRIMHSTAFRRMQGKTQVFGLGVGDFFRTRLTHSLEVAQIGKGIAIFCGHADTDLVEAAGLAHDIGHPPFGHTGEKVLKQKMEDSGGFEANTQNLRVLSRLEFRTALKEQEGLNLTRATLDALLKYKTPYKTPYSKVNKEKPKAKWRFYYDEDDELVKWASKGSPSADAKSFECQIMNWADDIAYSTHDLEDGIKAGLISRAKISSRIQRNVQQRVGDNWNEELYG